MKPKLVKKLRALYWAEIHMREAQDACLHVLQLGNISQELSHALFTGIVVSYARPFGANQGLPALETAFKTFPTAKAQRLHDGLLEARNLIYAHNDRVTVPTSLNPSVSAAQMNEIEIQIEPSGSSNWLIRRPTLGTSHVEPIGALCEFQIERLNKTSTAILQEFCKGKAYRPGAYTLGVDFP